MEEGLEGLFGVHQEDRFGGEFGARGEYFADEFSPEFRLPKSFFFFFFFFFFFLQGSEVFDFKGEFGLKSSYWAVSE